MITISVCLVQSVAKGKVLPALTHLALQRTVGCWSIYAEHRPAM